MYSVYKLVENYLMLDIINRYTNYDKPRQSTQSKITSPFFIFREIVQIIIKR